MAAFLMLALFGLLLSIFAHVATFFGRNPSADVPAIGMLHVGIFAAWIPAILAVRKWDTDSFWDEAMRFMPKWFPKIVLWFLVYVAFNFFFTIFVLNRGGVAGTIDGKRVLHNHGNVIKDLTAEEYERHQAYQVRIFSGHWTLFYGLATIMLYADWRKRFDARSLSDGNEPESLRDATR